MMAASPPRILRRSSAASYRVIDKNAKFCSTDVVALCSSLARRCAGRGSERSAEFGSVNLFGYPLARANSRETRRLLTNRPGSSFSTKRCGNGPCKRQRARVAVPQSDV